MAKYRLHGFIRRIRKEIADRYVYKGVLKDTADTDFHESPSTIDYETLASRFGRPALNRLVNLVEQLRYGISGETEVRE